jgi:hypothetical protein
MNKNFAIGVALFNKETVKWSKPYTYFSDMTYPEGAYVLVPCGIAYTIGKVVGSKPWVDAPTTAKYQPVLQDVSEMIQWHKSIKHQL